MSSHTELLAPPPLLDRPLLVDRIARARSTRVVFGIALILHGLAHAVLPMRGAGIIERFGWERVLMNTLWTTAIVAFVAAGCGVLGARPFRTVARGFVQLGAAASAIAIFAFAPGTLAWGLLLDLVASLGIRFLPVPTGVGRRWRAYVGSALAIGLVGWCFVTAVTRPWRDRWGTTADEVARPMPGDRIDRDPAFEMMHAVTIDAPPSRVWPWLAQVGEDKGGVTQAEPDRVLVLESWGAFVLEPGEGNTTRLIVRSKMSDPRAPVWGSALSFVMFELPHFIMERRMLLGIKERAEAAP